jgi:epoxyqueuosine reductase
MDLDTRLRTFALSLDADYYGVADLSAARQLIREQGGETAGRYPRAVVMGMVLPDSMVDLLSARDREGAILYRHSAYDVVNLALDQIALRVANLLRREGFDAFPVPASKRTSDEKISGSFSQKMAANLAGLGWIGKSCLLVTPEHGPRVRWVTILTNAPLATTGSPMESQCGDCRACVDICPQNAFTGREFHPDEPREARFDAAACDQYFREMEREKGVAVCGLCLYVCPYGRKEHSKR